jgi:hypothetical protein
MYRIGWSIQKMLMIEVEVSKNMMSFSSPANPVGQIGRVMVRATSLAFLAEWLVLCFDVACNAVVYLDSVVVDTFAWVHQNIQGHSYRRA